MFLTSPAPGWARVTARYLGWAGGSSRGWEKGEERKISFHRGTAARNAPSRKTFGNSSHGECVKHRQIEKGRGRVPMSQLLERYAVTRPWLMAAGQAAAMLGLNVLLRAAVS